MIRAATTDKENATNKPPSSPFGRGGLKRTGAALESNRTSPRAMKLGQQKQSSSNSGLGAISEFGNSNSADTEADFLAKERMDEAAKAGTRWTLEDFEIGEFLLTLIEYNIL